MKPTIAGRNVLLTGATGGIGEELAHHLARLGCNLFLTSTSPKSLEYLSQTLRSTSSEISVDFETAALEKPKDRVSLVKRVREAFEKIDILVNCAGIFEVKSLADSSELDYEKCFDVNVRAPFALCKEFSVDMINQQWGKIINIGSSSSYAGFRNTSLYCASKHALLGLSRSLYEELKPHNVRVYCFSPGSVQTEMGKLVEGQDFNTFIKADELAEYICYSILSNSNMIAQEVRINRLNTQ